MEHHAWPEIVSFDKVYKYASQFPEILRGKNVKTYFAKIKLHGNYGGIVVDLQNNTVYCQSRQQVLVDGVDCKGFAAWLKHNEQAWLTFISQNNNSEKSGVTKIIINGEWVGPGIQDNVAISKLDAKVFAVFAVQFIGVFENMYMINPIEIQKLIGDMPGVKILPWYLNGRKFEIDFSNQEQIKETLEVINREVLAVEECDPWVKQEFGIEGMGEGLVFYPLWAAQSDLVLIEDFRNLAFKAKGTKHAVVKTKQPAQIDTSKAASAKDFADLVVTEARLEQGVRAIANGNLTFEKKNVGALLKWMEIDIKKECQPELCVSGLAWEDVAKTVAERVRVWFLSKC